MTESQGISISLKRLVTSYFIVFAMLLSLNLVALWMEHGLGSDTAKGFIPLFHFDAEDNMPALFSFFLLIQASVVCLIISKSNGPDQKYWIALSIIFAVVALDEYFEYHERLMVPVRTALSASGFFYYAWIVPYGFLVLVLGIVLLPWLSRLPRRTRLGFIASAVLYLMGVLLLEGLSGWWFGVSGSQDLVFDALATVEESLEMLGPIVFVYFAVQYLFAESGNIKVKFGK